MGIAAVIVGVKKGEVRPSVYDWNSTIFNGTLHVRMAGVTFIFDDIQEGIDALTTLATVPPSGSTEANSEADSDANSDECGSVDMAIQLLRLRAVRLRRLPMSGGTGNHELR